MIQNLKIFALLSIRNCTFRNLFITVLRLYISDCFTRLIYYQELISKKIDISWLTIIYQNHLLHYCDCKLGRLYICLSRITYIKTPHTTIEIVHLVPYTPVHLRLDASDSFFKNVILLRWASSWFAFLISVIPNRAVQKSYAMNTVKAIRKFVSLSQV